MRRLVAFLGGLVFALVAGLVPGELTAMLREWAGREGPDGQTKPHFPGRRRRRRRH
jgi:hypothetical protein